MAVVVKNTFLDVAEYKFLHFDEPSCISRRSKSVPQQWKPSMPCATSVEANHVISGSQPCLFNTVSTDSLESTDASPSLFSAKDGSPSCKVCLQSALSSRNSRYYADAESEINAQEHSDSTIAPEEADAAYLWNCSTPTSSIDSPRDLAYDWSEDLTHGNLTPADAQRQLDEMSQKVMDIWAKLRAIESFAESDSEDTQCRSTPIVEKQAADLADNLEETVAPGRIKVCSRSRRSHRTRSTSSS